MLAVTAALLLLTLPAAASEPERRRAGTTEFYGTVESLPATTGWLGEWKVSGRRVRVDGATRIETRHGPVATGARVEVKGAAQPDGSLKASRIEVERGR